MKFRKYIFGYTFLFLSLVSIFLGVYYFYTPKKISSHQNENVLGASVVSLNRIGSYDIEFTDLDGKTKSIRHLNCESYDSRPGVTSSLKYTCIRNYKAEFTNSILQKNNVLSIIRNQVTVNITTPILYGKREINLFTNPILSYDSNLGTAVPKARPILESVSGKPIMFHFGGIHEINIKNNSTYLLTRYFDTDAYYSRGMEFGNNPNQVYKLSTSNTFYLVSPVITNIPQQSCYSCSQTSINKDTCNYAGVNSNLYCPSFAGEVGKGMLSPELVREGYMKGSTRNEWLNSYAPQTFRGDRAGYADPNNRPKIRYQNDPYVDIIVLGDCGSSGCASGVATNEGTLNVISKRSNQLPYLQGYGIPFKLNCIGKTPDSSCTEVILTGSRRDKPYNSRDNQTYMSYASLRWWNKLGTNLQINCSSKSSKPSSYTSCYEDKELLYNDFDPLSNFSGGYEIPEFVYDYYNTKDCQLSGSATGRTACVRTIDWDLNGRIYYFNSYTKFPSNSPSYAKPANFPPNNVNFYFTNESSFYAIKINPAGGDFARGSMDVYRYWIDFASNRPQSVKFSYSFTAESPAPLFTRKDEISVAISPTTSDIDLMFSSLNGSNSNNSNQLRIFRITGGVLPVNPREPRAGVTSVSEATLYDKAATAKIIDITNRFNFGGAYPLTFRRYVEDGNDGSGYAKGTEYYVFVSKDSVFHSAVPDTSECKINLASMNIVNTNPNSLFYGIDRVSGFRVSGFKGLILDSSKGIYCVNQLNGTDMLDKPVTAALITFYDPISNAKIASFATNQINQSKTFTFAGALDSFFARFYRGAKLNFDLNFSAGNRNILVNKSTNPNLFAKDYTIYLESQLNLALSQAGRSLNLTSTPISISVKKGSQNALSLNLANKQNPVSINSSQFNNLYFDHNLNLSGNSLVDTLVYRICFPYNILSASSTSNTLLSVAIDSTNPRCINTRYQNNNISSYTIIPQTLTVNLSEVLVPSIGNFEFNGNVYSNTPLSGNFIYKNSDKKLEGSYISSGSFTNSTYKFLNKALFGMNRPAGLPASLVGFTLGSNFDSPNLFKNFNLLFKNVSYVENNPISNNDYVVLNPVSTNNYEIIAISKGRGILIDLTDVNIQKDFSKYILVNMDPNNDSRIAFWIKCPSPSYDSICVYRTNFNFKGSLLGPFSVVGALDSTVINNKIIRIHENPDTLVNISPALRSKKYQMVTNTLVNLTYE